MIWAAVLAAGFGAGICLIARALMPPVRPLRVLAGELAEPRAALLVNVGPAGSLRRWWRRVAVRLGGGPSERLSADLAVLGRSGVRHAVDKLGYALVCLCSGLVPVVLFPLLDVAMPPASTVLAVLLLAVAGWTYPDLEVRSRARRARRSWNRAVTVYVDIVGISLAGGAGVEDALMVAADVGTGPEFGELRNTLRAAQTRRHKLWHAIDELGARIDVVPLRELAAAVDLAAESGSRIRETLIAKAGAMRARQLAETEADAQKASETMGIAPALMAIAAVVLIGYPAVARFLE
jgi:Flp pilus assembly protein TadB